MAAEDNKAGELPDDLAERMKEIIKEMEEKESADPNFKGLSGKTIEFYEKDGAVAWYIAYRTN
jgi:hypothetical protein